MWELDPRFHTPGYVERRLQELAEEKQQIRPAGEGFEFIPPALFSLEQLEQIRAVVREELQALDEDDSSTVDSSTDEIDRKLYEAVTSALDRVSTCYRSFGGFVAPVTFNEQKAKSIGIELVRRIKEIISQ